jgi:hypothetical protein
VIRATTTRAQAFKGLRQNVELTGLQKSTVSKRQGNIRDALAGQLAVREDFLVGSYCRHTLIGPLKDADVDVIVVLDPQYREMGPAGVLDLVRKALLKEYSKTPGISRNGQAVTVRFSDFTIDVVPAFELSWGQRFWRADEARWAICDSADDVWIMTNPRKHIELSAKANRKHGERFVPAVKEIKAWNRTVGSPLRSFHLEMLCRSIFTFWLYTGMGEDWDNINFFFRKARRRLKKQLGDPGGGGRDVGSYLFGKELDVAVELVDEAYQGSRRALKAADNGDRTAMHAEYEAIFGDYYP